MSLSVADDSVILDNGVRIKFLRDAEYAAAPPIVGMYGDVQTLLQCTSDGKLVVEANLEASSITIGDVVMQALDSVGAKQFLQVETDPVTSRYALLVNDPRFTFSANQLLVNCSGTVAVSNLPVTQPVSGTVTATQGGAPWSENITQIGGASLALGQTSMANSVPVAIANDQTMQPFTDLSITGTITALNGSVTLPVHGCGSAIFTVTGTWAGTLEMQGLAADGVTWLTLVGNTGPTGTYAVQNNITVNGSYKAVNIASFTQIRITATAFTSGPVNVGIVAATPVQRIEAFQLNAANMNATVSGTVAVSSLPSLPAGANAIGTVTASGASAVGMPPSLPPVYIGGIDGGGLKRGILTDTTGAQITSRASGTLNTGQVAVGPSATLVLAANPSRRRLVITNTSTVAVYVGGSGVTTSTGQYMAGIPGFPLVIYHTGAVYAVSSSGTQTVSYQEEAI